MAALVQVNANGGRGQYRAWRGQARADECARRPKAGKLATCPKLAAVVTDGLAQNWSPQQIAHRLRADFPDDPEMRVSHETIYQSLFVHGRGALRKELIRCLRSGRTQRKPHGRAVSGAGRLR